MARPQAARLSSNQPDFHVLRALGAIHRVLVVVVATIAAISLCRWTIPPVHRLLQYLPYWSIMKANTALLILLCAVSVTLSEPRRSTRALHVSRFLAGFATVFAAVLVFERFSGITLPIDTLLAADATSEFPGRVSIETCGTLMLIGFVLRNLRLRKRRLAHAVDGVTLGIIFLMLTFTARYVFGLTHVLAESVRDPMSVPTFACLGILTWLIVNRRAEYGAFSVLIGSQIGGRTARFAAPCALLLPFIFALGRMMSVRIHLASELVATATATASMAMCAFFLVLALARKTNDLENALRELSLRDELTRVYNRRGFYLLAEQALRLAQRSGESFFVLFIDVDDLKKTNDVLGHEVGSELLATVAGLIVQTFRETDVIGRIGGDEFVVAGQFGNEGVANPMRRLEESVARENAMPGRPYEISFSLGLVLSERASSETLEEMLQRADATMYDAKRTKKRLRAEGVAEPAMSATA
jgi:diguanylate cyclase (GGDEF)-like protein